MQKQEQSPPLFVMGVDVDSPHFYVPVVLVVHDYRLIGQYRVDFHGESVYV